MHHKTDDPDFPDLIFEKVNEFMFLLIDNYDSFTFNLVQEFMGLGRTPRVIRNDDPALLDLATDPALEMVCISPGPGHPDSAGLCMEFLQRLPARIPVLGVCLGHQILGSFFGSSIGIAKQIMHGKQSYITHDGTGLFHGLPQNMRAGRYHSLRVSEPEENIPIIVTARSEDGEIMGIRIADRPWAGVQFHPESILTPKGRQLLFNFPEALLQTENLEKMSPRTGTVSKTLQIQEVMETLAQGQDMDGDVAGLVFSRLMDGELSPAQAGAFLMALRYKGEAPQELHAAATAVLQRAVAVPPIPGPTIDVVGTGGDGKFSFNCSTATALMLAGMGYKVLKHGNRSISSRSGSADVLERLGVPLNLDPSKIVSQLEENGFAYLFAPNYHPSFRHIMPLRIDLGMRTLFNILGPLVNPAKPTHRLLGAANTDTMLLLARTLVEEGGVTGAVVCGFGGYDEMTPTGVADIVFVFDQEVRRTTMDPQAYGFGLRNEEELAIDNPEHAAAVLRELLRGQGPQPMQDMLALNLGLALYLLDHKAEKPAPALGYDHSLMQICMERAKEAVAGGVGKRFAGAAKL